MSGLKKREQNRLHRLRDQPMRRLPACPVRNQVVIAAVQIQQIDQCQRRFGGSEFMPHGETDDRSIRDVRHDDWQRATETIAMRRRPVAVDGRYLLALPDAAERTLERPRNVATNGHRHAAMVDRFSWGSPPRGGSHNLSTFGSSMPRVFQDRSNCVARNHIFRPNPPVNAPFAR